MNSSLKTGWHVLYVRSRCEKKVEALLKEKEQIVFLPMVKTVRKWSDRKKVIETPLFPSYVFVKINSAKDFHHTLSVDGACTYIQFGKEYARVSESEIKKIKLFLNSDDTLNIETSSQFIKIGETKMIEQGPLSGLECEIVKVNNVNKIVVRIKSIQQNIIATLPKHYLSELSMAI